MSDVARYLSLAEAGNRLADLLEAVSGRKNGLRHPRHVKAISKARKAVATIMRQFFKRQETALLVAVRPRIQYALLILPAPKLVEARKPAAKTFADHVLPDSLSPLRFAATLAEMDSYNSAITSAITSAGKTLAKEIDAPAISETAAARWLRENSLGKLTGELNKTTTDRLRDSIADAWESGGAFDDIVSAIRSEYEDFSETRAEMIAQTEVNEAYNFGRNETAREAGYEEKAWDPDGEACEICLGNVDDGWIGIDEDFSSGDDQPPAHPNCDCGTNFRKASED